MKNFQHINASDVETAVKYLQEPQTVAIAGGTDLMTELKNGIRSPAKLVNIKPIARMRQLDKHDGNLHMGSLTTIADIESSPRIREDYPILSQAAGTVGSLQLRNTGTVGGNLCQSVRCWYYRHQDVQCWLKDGDTCYARNGNNRHHAIFGKIACIAVNPSDIAPALMALDATVRVAGNDGTKEMAIESLFEPPKPSRRKQNVLDPGDVIETVIVPSRPDHSTGTYLKVMERAAWGFALVSVAVQIDWDGDRVRNSRIVLGGVAGIPWRTREAEQLMAGNGIDEALAERVSKAAVSGASPLEWNSYKVPMVRNLLKRAMLSLTPPP